MATKLHAGQFYAEYHGRMGPLLTHQLAEKALAGARNLDFLIF